jgi:hypothetical protein
MTIWFLSYEGKYPAGMAIYYYPAPFALNGGTLVIVTQGRGDVMG